MEQFLSIDEASSVLSLKKDTLYHMVSRRQIPHYKIRKLVRFRLSDIEAWIEARRVETDEKQISKKDDARIDALVEKTLAKRFRSR